MISNKKVSIFNLGRHWGWFSTPSAVWLMKLSVKAPLLVVCMMAVFFSDE